MALIPERRYAEVDGGSHLFTTVGEMDRNDNYLRSKLFVTMRHLFTTKKIERRQQAVSILAL